MRFKKEKAGKRIVGVYLSPEEYDDLCYLVDTVGIKKTEFVKACVDLFGGKESVLSKFLPKDEKSS